MKRNDWTKAEDDRLRELYPKSGTACISEFPGRTRKALKTHAKYIGLRVTGHRRVEGGWTFEEDDILRTHYAISGGPRVAEMVGRTLGAVRTRAQLIGVSGAKKPPPQRPAKKPSEMRVRPIVAPKVVPATRIPAAHFKGEARVTNETKVTIAPPFVDRRFAVDQAPAVVNSSKCRDWARWVAA